MKSNIFLQVIISLSILLNAWQATAAPIAKQDALEFANIRGEELLLSFQEPNLSIRYQKLDALFNKYIDVDYIAKFVVGKYWRIMTAEQREKYLSIFRRYGLAYYKTLPLDFAFNLTYKVLGAESDGKFTNVSALVHLNTQSERPQDVNLMFRLHESGGIIKAVDVKIAESSMLLAYRSKFYEMIAKNEEEIDWFLEDLEDTTVAWEESLKQQQE